MKRIVKVFMLVPLITLTFISCQKSTPPPPKNLLKQNNLNAINLKSLPRIEAINGILVFKNWGQYFNTIKLLSHHSNNEVCHWAKTMGFESLNQKLDKIENILDKVNSVSELNIVLKHYADYLTTQLSQVN